MPVEHLVLITGAGASRNLSSSRAPMPLMADWNEALRKALEEQDLSLSSMVGIHRGQTGPDFEKAIGDFLTWQRLLDLSARFLPLGMEVLIDSSSEDWRLRADARARTVTTVFRRSLYDQFGKDRISTAGATTAYGSLFEALDQVSGGSLAIATTTTTRRSRSLSPNYECDRRSAKSMARAD